MTGKRIWRGAFARGAREIGTTHSPNYHRAIFGKLGLKRALAESSRAPERPLFSPSAACKKDLLAEILPLGNRSREQSRCAAAGRATLPDRGIAPRAEIVYRGLLRENTDDPDSSWIGDAELALGNYRVAEGGVSECDPNGRTGAGSNKKYNCRERSPSSIRPSAAYSDESSAGPPDFTARPRCARFLCGRGGAAGQKISERKSCWRRRVRGNPANELAEERLSMAERLWQTRIKACDKVTWTRRNRCAGHGQDRS